MNTRPVSITIIGWLLIAGGILGMINSALIELSPIAKEVAARSIVPVPVQEIYGLIDGIIVAACGIGFLQGLWWSRLVYLVWALLRLGFGLFVSPVWVIVAVFIFYAVIVSVLCRRSANLWFENSAY
jgi:hypothetical protein